MKEAAAVVAKLRAKAKEYAGLADALENLDKVVDAASRVVASVAEDAPLKRHISPAGRARIRAAQRKRWAAKKAASARMSALAKKGAAKRKAEKKLEAGL